MRIIALKKESGEFRQVLKQIIPSTILLNSIPSAAEVRGLYGTSL